MKTRFFFLITFLLALAGLEQGHAQSYADDTVWTNKTDQSEGFYKVKFSDNDSIVVGHGYNDVLFFDSETGNEIVRIPGNKEVFFFNDDKNFLRLNNDRINLEVFDSFTFQVIDTLENDGATIGAMNISKDRSEFISIINNSNGVRIWDLSTKMIINTKIFEKDNDPDLISIDRKKINFTCDASEFYITIEKLFKDGEQKTYYFLYHALFDSQTFDSVDVINYAGYFRLSNSCSKIAYLFSRPDYGVEVYDFNTKELLWKIPVNGPSLTGIEFSPNNKYLVTSSGLQNHMDIWNVDSKDKIYSYLNSSYMNFDLSNNGQYITASVGRSLKLLYTRWNGVLVEEEPQNPIILYPNPTNGNITLSFEQQIPEITSINLNDINGVLIRKLFNNFIEPGQQNLTFDVNDLASGTYYINVSNSHLSLFFKLIINK